MIIIIIIINIIINIIIINIIIITITIIVIATTIQTEWRWNSIFIIYSKDINNLLKH